MICLQPEPEYPESVAVCRLVWRREIHPGWMEVQWTKVTKTTVRRGRSKVSVEWIDRVVKASIILYGFELKCIEIAIAIFTLP